MSEVLAVESVSKSFGALKAVLEISFAVNAKEIFGIAGPNGSGKSTLFNIITGIPFGPDSGTVRFDGKQIQQLPPQAIARSGLVRTFQKETCFETLPALANVALAAVYRGGGRGRAMAHAAAVEALRMVDLDETEWVRPAGELSVFDKKRLMLASALAMRPRILLLDEPASGLTKPEIQATIALIRRINALGIAIVLIEHVLPLLLAVSERLMVLNQGTVLVTGEPDTVVRDERVIEAYLGSRGRRDDVAA
jgi:branched-chain amino acid transport system ATP-binding protein